MEAAFVILANSASIDQATNQLSLFGLIEDLVVASFPVALPNPVFCVLLSRKANEAEKVAVTFAAKFSDDRKPLFQSSEATVDFQGKRRLRFVAQLPPIVIPRLGELEFFVQTKRKVLGHWTILVAKIDASPTLEMTTGKTVAGPVMASAKKAKKRRAKKAKKSRGHP
jgi:hypothetical protein